MSQGSDSSASDNSQARYAAPLPLPPVKDLNPGCLEQFADLKDLAFVVAVQVDGTQTLFKPAKVRVQTAPPEGIPAKLISKPTAAGWIPFQQNPFCIGYVSSDGSWVYFCID